MLPSHLKSNAAELPNFMRVLIRQRFSRLTPRCFCTEPTSMNPALWQSVWNYQKSSAGCLSAIAGQRLRPFVRQATRLKVQTPNSGGCSILSWFQVLLASAPFRPVDSLSMIGLGLFSPRIAQFDDWRWFHAVCKRGSEPAPQSSSSKW